MYIIVFLCLDYICNTKFADWRQFFWSFVAGHGIDPVLWYQWVLILLTLLFLLLNSLFQNVFALCALFLLAWIFEYTGANFSLFGNLRHELSYPLGRVCEMLPYMCTGIVLGKRYSDLLSLGVKKKILLLSVALIAAFLSVLFHKLVKVSGFGYGGISLYFVSVCIFLLFTMLPVSRIDKLNNIASFFAVGTSGCYCIHKLIITLVDFELAKLEMSIHTLAETFFVFAISMGISLAMKKTFR